MSLLTKQNYNVAYVSNQLIPDEGPKAIPLILDFTAFDTFNLDLQQQEQQAIIQMIQTVFIDLQDSNVPLMLTIEGTGQVIKAAPRTQGYYPVLCPNPSRLRFDCPGGPLLKVFLVNVPVGGSHWVTQ